MSLAGKCSVVYSGARGIGRAYCEHLLQNGCKVYFGDILVEEGSQTAKELQSRYKDSTIIFQKCDVLIETEVKELLERAISECDHVDIVIANTGILDETDWQKCMQLNLGSILRVFYITMEHMSKSNGGKGGDFIATASVAGFKPSGNAPIYTATKHAIVGFVRAWGTESNYALTNIRCNCICPFWVRTKLLLEIKPELFSLKEQGQSSLARHAKLRADGYISPDEVGKSLITLLENTADNGQCLIVDKDGTSYVKFSEEPI